MATPTIYFVATELSTATPLFMSDSLENVYMMACRRALEGQALDDPGFRIETPPGNPFVICAGVTENLIPPSPLVRVDAMQPGEYKPESNPLARVMPYSKTAITHMNACRLALGLPLIWHDESEGNIARRVTQAGAATLSISLDARALATEARLVISSPHIPSSPLEYERGNPYQLEKNAALFARQVMKQEIKLYAL